MPHASRPQPVALARARRAAQASADANRFVLPPHVQRWRAKLGIGSGSPAQIRRGRRRSGGRRGRDCGGWKDAWIWMKAVEDKRWKLGNERSGPWTLPGVFCEEKV